jgi:[acyl-carrier-protein] S-malonyltransferase
MGKDLYNRYPQSAKQVFDEADDALGGGLVKLIFDGQQVRSKKSLLD